MTYLSEVLKLWVVGTKDLLELAGTDDGVLSGPNLLQEGCILACHDTYTFNASW